MSKISEYVRKYADRSQYSGDNSRPTISSSVSEAKGEVFYDGVNVETIRPQVADAVYHDSQSIVHFIRKGTLNRALLPSDYTPVGVVTNVWGRKVRIVYYKNSSYKYCDVYRWKVTGAAMTDGASHTATVTLQGTAVSAQFTWQTTTIQAFVNAFNSFLSANNVTSHWMYVEDDTQYVSSPTVYLVWGRYTTSVSTTTITGITLAVALIEEITASNAFYNKYGDTHGKIWSVARAIDYFRADNSSTSYNPASDLTDIPGDPVCLPAYLGTSQYQSDHCAYLRNIFGEGEEGWVNYIENMTIQYPCLKGAQAIEDQQVRETDSIAHYRVKNAAGERANYLYPAYHACCGLSFNAPGLDLGNWHMAGPGRLREIFETITYGTTGHTTVATADDINKTISAMGGAVLSTTVGRWLAGKWDKDSFTMVTGLGYPVQGKDALVYYRLIRNVMPSNWVVAYCEYCLS